MTSKTKDGKDSHSLGLADQSVQQAQNWPTPNSSDQYNPNLKDNHDRSYLRGVAATWATPTSRDHKDGTNPSEAVPTNSLLGRQAPRTQTGGSESLENGQTSPRPSTKRLNPSFVEWVMGVPIGWTSLKPLATESYQQWLRSFLGEGQPDE